MSETADFTRFRSGNGLKDAKSTYYVHKYVVRTIETYEN